MIDIIVPVYNTPINDLKRCLDSISGQMFRNYKVYIIDDGSLDEVKLFLDEYVSDKDNFIVKHVNNGGVSRARNIGIDSSNSEYLTFVDSDDTVEETFLEEAFSLISDNDLDVVIGGYNEVKNGEVVKVRKCCKGFYVYKDDGLKLFSLKLLSSKVREDNREIGTAPVGRIYTRLYKRSILGNLRFNENIKMSEDTLFMIDLMSKVKRIGLSSNVWYNYYINDYSVSRNAISKGVIDNNLDFIREIYKRMVNISDIDIKNAFKIRILKATSNLLSMVSSDMQNEILNMDFVKEGLEDVDLSGYLDGFSMEKDYKKIVDKI